MFNFEELTIPMASKTSEMSHFSPPTQFYIEHEQKDSQHELDTYITVLLDKHKLGQA